MSKQALITAALIEWLQNFPAPSDTGVPIVDSIEKEYKPVLDTLYLSAQVFVSETDTLYVGPGTFRYQGILQVTVNSPRLRGVIQAQEWAGLLIDYFKKDTIIDGDGVRIRIIRQPSQATPTNDGPWVRLPISINYHCMA